MAAAATAIMEGMAEPPWLGFIAQRSVVHYVAGHQLTIFAILIPTPLNKTKGLYQPEKGPSFITWELI